MKEQKPEPAETQPLVFWFAVPASQVIRLKVKLRLTIEHLIWASELGQGPLPPLGGPP